VKRFPFLAAGGGRRVLGTGLLLATAAVTRAEMKLVIDREVAALLPNRHAVANVDDKLFRSLDGRALHFGPDPEGRHYEITGAGVFRERKAPAHGKAYLDAQGRFALWYERVDLGVHFADGRVLRLPQPAETRFGVSYGAQFYYLADAARTRVFALDQPDPPVVTLEGFYALKVVPWEDRLYLLGHERFRGEAARRALAVVFQRLADGFVETRRHPLPEEWLVLDFDAEAEAVLLLDPGPVFPLLYRRGLREGVARPLGPVDEFGIFLHRDFPLRAP
jgi:hypothetical protein